MAADVSLEAELLGLARRAAIAAGAELLERWRGPLEVSTKSTPTDPVSEADVAAERAIRALITDERPQDAILGEEGGETDGAMAARRGSVGGEDSDRGETLRWVVDPLDGTVNYLYGLPSFVVSVAVEDSEGGLAAAILQPTTGDLYLATRSGPAVAIYKGRGEGEVLHGSGCERLDRALLGTGFAYDPAVRAAQGRLIANLIGEVRDIRRAGAAALDMAWVAAGRLDAYFERGVKAWDIAAGTLICERAGVAVRPIGAETDPSGSGVPLPRGVMAAPSALIDDLGRTLTHAARR